MRIRLPFFAIILFALISCTEVVFDPQIKPDPEIEIQASGDSTIHFLALGDSYTIGQSVVVSGRWPIQLSARLEEQGYLVEQIQNTLNINKYK